MGVASCYKYFCILKLQKTIQDIIESDLRYRSISGSKTIKSRVIDASAKLNFIDKEIVFFLVFDSVFEIGIESDRISVFGVTGVI